MTEGTGGTGAAPAPAKQAATAKDVVRLVDRLAQLVLEGARFYEGAEDRVREELRKLRDEAAALL